jgi:ABC-type Fe3+-hydroxamate transport system substrate-binding protein
MMQCLRLCHFQSNYLASMILSTDNLTNGKKYSRIISLVPSQTELLFDLGLNEEVIGITKFCIHPEEWFRNKTRVGGTKNINFKMIQSISPDLIIANKEENLKEQVEDLAASYDVWGTDVNDLYDALNMINGLGILTGKVEAAALLALKIQTGFKDLERKNFKEKKIPAAYFIWKDPYMVAGGDTFINDMMQYAGLENIFAEKRRYPQICLEEIKKKKCEWILLSSEPYPFKQKHKEEIQIQLPGIRVELVDGEMFSWYGSRMLKSIDYFKSFQNKMNSV